jgi:hypothetical protein
MNRILFVFMVTIMLFVLYFVPFICKFDNQTGWGFYFIIPFVLTFVWGHVICKHFHYLFDKDR